MALAAAVVTIAALALGSGAAWAHADLAGSDPADGAQVEGPLTSLSFEFTAAVEPAGDDFAVVGADGQAIPVESVELGADGTSVVVTPAAPLDEGAYGATWAILAADGHVKTGSVSFAVTAPAAGEADEAVGGGASAAPPTSTPTTAPSGSADASGAGSAPVAAVDLGSSSPTLGAEQVATAARWVLYAALLLCVGGLAHLAWVHRGTVAEARWLVFLIRRATLVLIAATLVALAARVVVFAVGDVGALTSPAAWGDVLTASFGVGTILRLVGAGLVLAFLRIDVDDDLVVEDGPDFDRLSGSDLDLLGGPSGTLAVGARPTTSPLARLRVEASPMAFVGAALLVASAAFIGHTASSDPRALVVASDAGHLVAAAIWASGCVLLAATLARRARRGQPLDARLLAVRFSVVAGWALLGVAVTGLALAWGILDGVSGLWASTFGRVLLAKVAVVAAVAGLGAYNHRVVVPALTEGADGADATFRRTVTAEAGLMVVVLALTAVLVASSTT